MIICVTGADGFVGRNLLARLGTLPDMEVRTITRQTPGEAYMSILDNVDVVYHLAGVNRPESEAEFQTGNTDLTRTLLERIPPGSKTVRFIICSSTQAELDNPYGKSKLAAEEILRSSNHKHIRATIYRLPGIFGKWCRPNYNSVVATFCHNIANGLDIQVNQPDRLLTLVYIDDVVDEFVRLLSSNDTTETSYGAIPVQFNITLGQLAETIRSFPHARESLLLPAVGDLLVKNLYSTYLSYLPANAFSYPLQPRTDERGSLYEWIKHKELGQVFVSFTKPGITRGNHYHHTKTEKFLVIQGEAEIQFRRIDASEVISYKVSGSSPQVVDIPPGYTHNITNTGKTELITLFWANEVFDPGRPDTILLKVL